jgi:hypothetical protein
MRIYEITSTINNMPVDDTGEFKSEQDAENFASMNGIENYMITNYEDFEIGFLGLEECKEPEVLAMVEELKHLFD